MSDRLRARIDRDFPEPGSADDVARLVAGASDDWRDTLCAAGLERDDWPSRVDVELGAVR